MAPIVMHLWTCVIFGDPPNGEGFPWASVFKPPPNQGPSIKVTSHCPRLYSKPLSARGVRMPADRGRRRGVPGAEQLGASVSSWAGLLREPFGLMEPKRRAILK